MRWLAAVAALILAACDFAETTRETGHKGRARVNPYLAAERMLEALDHEVARESGWPDLDGEHAMLLLPVSVLAADGYVRELERWVGWGGHAVIFLERGERYLNDWNDGFSRMADGTEVPETFDEWLARAGIRVSDGEKTSVERVTVEGEEFEVWMESSHRIGSGAGEGPIASVEFGEGRLTVMADARPFRNRYIGDHQHASLLEWLSDLSPYYGPVVFVRNASLSFWSLLWERAWALVVALVALVGLWLWKNFPRFGPLDSREEGGDLRAYDHHLEALGDFHWRLDRGEGLLRPLRDSLTERGHRLALATGRPDADVFGLIAERAGIPRERAERAMTFDRARDAGSFTRLVADLQKLHLSIP